MSEPVIACELSSQTIQYVTKSTMFSTDSSNKIKVTLRSHKISIKNLLTMAYSLFR